MWTPVLLCLIACLACGQGSSDNEASLSDNVLICDNMVQYDNIDFGAEWLILDKRAQENNGTGFPGLPPTVTSAKSRQQPSWYYTHGTLLDAGQPEPGEVIEVARKCGYVRRQQNVIKTWLVNSTWDGPSNKEYNTVPKAKQSLNLVVLRIVVDSKDGRGCGTKKRHQHCVFSSYRDQERCSENDVKKALFGTSRFEWPRVSIKTTFEMPTRGRVQINGYVRTVRVPLKLVEGRGLINVGWGRKKSLADDLRRFVSLLVPEIKSTDRVVYIFPANFYRNKIWAKRYVGPFPNDFVNRDLHGRVATSSVVGRAYSYKHEVLVQGCQYGALSHEIGHQLGLGHAGAYLRYLYFSHYHDLSSIMSGALRIPWRDAPFAKTRRRGLNAPQIFALGGLFDDEILDIDFMAEPRSFRILSLSSSASDRERTARVKTRNGIWLWLEWREKDRPDVDLDNFRTCKTFLQGPLVGSLLVHVIKSGPKISTSLEAVIRLGETININGVTITHHHRKRGHFTVKYERKHPSFCWRMRMRLFKRARNIIDRCAEARRPLTCAENKMQEIWQISDRLGMGSKYLFGYMFTPCINKSRWHTRRRRHGRRLRRHHSRRRRRQRR